ncbi:hypothetical protein ACQP2E_20230 [Actinoplanes sp. CA-015351]
MTHTAPRRSEDFVLWAAGIPNASAAAEILFGTPEPSHTAATRELRAAAV